MPASNSAALQALSDEYRAAVAAMPLQQARQEFEGTWVDAAQWPANEAAPLVTPESPVPDVLVPDEPPAPPVIVTPGAESEPVDPGKPVRTRSARTK